MRLLSKFVVFMTLAFAFGSLAEAQQKASILPQSFEGWEMTGKPQAGTDPAAVDQAHPAVLKEYGFTDFEVANYTRPDRKLTVKAARFQDATGAYGSLTFYRQPKMNTENIGLLA